MKCYWCETDLRGFPFQTFRPWLGETIKICEDCIADIVMTALEEK